MVLLLILTVTSVAGIYGSCDSPISFLGFQPAETVADFDVFQKIALTEDINVLTEMIVTVLGIKRVKYDWAFHKTP